MRHLPFPFSTMKPHILMRAGCYVAIALEGVPFTHLVFVVSLLLCSYNFLRSVTLDPGSCPKPSSDSELRSVSTILTPLQVLFLSVLNHISGNRLSRTSLDKED